MSQRYLQKCVEGLPQSQTTAQHFAYPYNRVNSKVEKYTSKYYLSGYTFWSRLRNFLLWKNPLKIPRIGVSKKDSPANLIKFAG